MSDSKHELHNKWTLWFDMNTGSKNKTQNWGSQLKQVVTFSSVEDFWG